MAGSKTISVDMQAAAARKRKPSCAKMRAAVIAAFETDAQNKTRLDAALAEDVLIAVVPPRVLAPAFGMYNKTPEGDKILRVANTGDLVDMVSVLDHELRHYEQDGSSPFSFYNFGNALFNELVSEADAFTQQVISALMARKRGDERFMRKLSEESAAHPLEKDLELQVSKRRDLAFIARGVFATSLLRLAVYKHRHYGEVMNIIEEVPDVETMREVCQAEFNVPLVEPIAALVAHYGHDYAQGVDMRALKTAFMRTLPMAERRFIYEVERLARRVQDMTQDEFDLAREALAPLCDAALESAEMGQVREAQRYQSPARRGFMDAALKKAPPSTVRPRPVKMRGYG